MVDLVHWLTMIRRCGGKMCRDSVCDLLQFVNEKSTETVTQLGGVLSTG